METTELFTQIAESWWVFLAIFVVAWYFFSRYFIQTIEKKDQQIKEIIDKFSTSMERINSSLIEMTYELKDIKEEITIIKDKHK